MTVKTHTERRVRRQKQFIAVGTVCLLAILGFELPKLLGGGSETEPTVTAATQVVTGSSLPVRVAKLHDTDRILVRHDSNQLISFGLFESKDPFVQQLSASSSTPPSSATGPTGTTAKKKPAPSVLPTIPRPAPAPPAVPGTTTPAPVVPGPEVLPASVPIATNGVCETVAVNGTFPSGENIFRLVSIAKDGKSVEVAVVGGSYDSGQASAPLELGDTLTLVNTADGTRYVIALKAKCDAPTVPAPATTEPAASIPATTDPVATVPEPLPPPTTTVTTPIVPDSLDTTTTTSTAPSG